jgi:hypothetical protein
MIDPEIIRTIFTANLSFTAFLLAVIGIIIPIYVAAPISFKNKYRNLLRILGVDFSISIFVTISCLAYLLNIPVGAVQAPICFDSGLLIVSCFSVEMIVLTVGAIIFILSIT